jgi:hypothetical protein
MKCVLAVLLILICTSFARADGVPDTIDTFYVNSSFRPANSVPSTAPTIFLSGIFTLDVNTSTISNWSMTLSDVNGVGQLSPLNGGTASAFCYGGAPNCLGDNAIAWGFGFSQGTDFVGLNTLLNAGGLIFGSNNALCSENDEYHEAVGCLNTSVAGFDGQLGVVWNGDPSHNGSGTSGSLYLINSSSSPASMPEPSTCLLLATGALIVGLIERCYGFATPKVSAVLRAKRD